MTKTLMKPVLLNTLALLCLFLLPAFAVNSRARQVEKLDDAELAKDLKSLELFLKLMPLENRTLEEVKSFMGMTRRDEIDAEINLGFGAKKVSCGRRGGYTVISLDIFVFEGSIKNYKVKVVGSEETWVQIRDRIAEAWLRNGGQPFQDDSSGLSYNKVLDVDFRSYKDAATAELGKMKVVDVPIELKNYYEELIAVSGDLTIAFGGCGWGSSIPSGRISIDALVKSGRIDLIENVLRGYNPGGRVYAALALRGMEKAGTKLSDDTQSTLTKVSDLEIKVRTCSGCIGAHRTAKEILAERKE